MKERINKISKTLKEWEYKKPGPARILLDPTDNCNLNCLFCWRNDSNQVKEEISDERLLELVNEAVSLGVKEWVISGGGDPFSRKRILMQLIRKIKEKGMWGQVITNGTLLDNKSISDLIDVGWDQVQVSLDGPRKVHDFLRGKKGTFNKVIQTIKLFNKYKKELNKTKPHIGFNVVLCNKNYKYISYLIKLAYQFGCNQVWFEMVAPWSEEAKKLQFSENERKKLDAYIKKGKVLADRLNLWTNIHYYLFEDLSGDTVSNEKEDNLENYCLAPWFSVKIHPTGVAGPCCSFYRHESLGNIKNDSLRKIWYRNFEKLRRSILEKKLPLYCKDCTEGQKRELVEIKGKIASM